LETENYTDENKNWSEPLEAAEILSAKDATVIESLEIEMSPYVSDSGCEQHSSIVSETFIKEIPPTVLDDRTPRRFN
jgi:hypothetical protein